VQRIIGNERSPVLLEAKAKGRLHLDQTTVRQIWVELYECYDTAAKILRVADWQATNRPDPTQSAEELEVFETIQPVIRDRRATDESHIVIHEEQAIERRKPIGISVKPKLLVSFIGNSSYTHQQVLPITDD
jgi:hypothetical protein